MATLKMKYGVISADDHVQEAPDVWTNRMSKTKFGDEIPHIVDLPDGSQTWALGRNSKGFGGLARIAGVKAKVRTWDEVPRIHLRRFRASENFGPRGSRRFGALPQHYWHHQSEFSERGQ